MHVTFDQFFNHLKINKLTYFFNLCNFSILPYRRLRGKLHVITVTLPALRTLHAGYDQTLMKVSFSCNSFIEMKQLVICNRMCFWMEAFLLLFLIVMPDAGYPHSFVCVPGLLQFNSCRPPFVPTLILPELCCSK